MPEAGAAHALVPSKPPPLAVPGRLGLAYDHSQAVTKVAARWPHRSQCSHRVRPCGDADQRERRARMATLLMPSREMQ